MTVDQSQGRRVYSGLSAGWTASTLSAVNALVLTPTIIATLGFNGAAPWFLLDVVLASAAILDLGAGRLYVHYLSSGRRYRRLAELERFCALFNQASGVLAGACVALYYLLGEMSRANTLPEKTITALAICLFGSACGHLALSRVQSEVTGELGRYTLKLGFVNLLGNSSATAVAIATSTPSAVVTIHALVFAVLTYACFRPRSLLQAEASHLSARAALTWAKRSAPFFLSSLPSLLMSPLVRGVSVIGLSSADFALFSFLLRAAGFVNNGFAVLTGQAHAIFRRLDRRSAALFLARQSTVIATVSLILMLLSLTLSDQAVSLVPNTLSVVLQPKFIIVVIGYGTTLVVLELVLRNALANKAFLTLSMLRLLNLGVVAATALALALLGRLSVTSLLWALTSSCLVTLAAGIQRLISRGTSSACNGSLQSDDLPSFESTRFRSESKRQATTLREPNE